MDWRSRDTLNVGLLLIGIAGLFFSFELINGKFPPQSSLTMVTGRLNYVERVTTKHSLSAVRFTLASDPRHFQYTNRSGAIDQVLEALQKAANSQVRVAFDPADSHTPWFEDRALYSVYELAVDGRIVRSYSQAVSSSNTDDSIGRWVEYISATGGIFVLCIRRRA
jgi:hypothetical protein